MLMDKWWHDSGCSTNGSSTTFWDNPMFKMKCPHLEITCQNSTALECEIDVLGCNSCICTDGRYAAYDQLHAAWHRNQMIYQEYMDAYENVLQIYRDENHC
ncbi:uncharacterized protein LOC120341772 isoform X2 [Styela clava]